MGRGPSNLAGVADVSSGEEYDFVVLLRNSIQQINDVTVSEVFGRQNWQFPFSRPIQEMACFI
jgi:hypothetical protein